MITAQRLVAVAALAAVLTACNVTFFIGESVDQRVSATEFSGANLTDAQEADAFVLGSGEERIFRVDVPSDAPDALYLYLDDTLDLYVYRDTGGLYATSSGVDFFAAGTAGLSSASAQDELAPSVITANLVCPGSCVIVRSSLSDPLYVSVRNTSGSDRDVAFFATVRDFEDTVEGFEPDTLTFGTTEGALEVLGDVDRYDVEDDGEVELTFGATASGLDYRLSIYDVAGNLADELFVGDPPADVFAGEQIRIDAENGDERAGSAGKSRYQVEYQ